MLAAELAALAAELAALSALAAALRRLQGGLRTDKAAPGGNGKPADLHVVCMSMHLCTFRVCGCRA